jgi:hypothetical protein
MALVRENATQADWDNILVSRFAQNEIARLDAIDEKKAIRVRQYPAGTDAAATKQAQLAAQDKIVADCTAKKIRLVSEVNATKDATDPDLTFDPAATGNAWFTGAFTYRGVVRQVSRAAERNARRTAILAKIELDYRALQMTRIDVESNTDANMDVVNPQTQKTRRQVLLAGIDVQLASKEAEKAERVRDTSTTPAAP